MPIPQKENNETTSIHRKMRSRRVSEYDDIKQRLAICYVLKYKRRERQTNFPNKEMIKDKSKK